MVQATVSAEVECEESLREALLYAQIGLPQASRRGKGETREDKIALPLYLCLISLSLFHLLLTVAWKKSEEHHHTELEVVQRFHLETALIVG